MHRPCLCLNYHPVAFCFLIKYFYNKRSHWKKVFYEHTSENPILIV